MKALTWFLPGAEWDYEGSGRVLTYFYALFMGVILLNMIIGYVCHIFTKVHENAEAAFWENRLSITTEIEALISVYGAIFWKESTDSEVHETEVHKNQCDNRRLNFSVVPSVMPSQEDITPFFNWWFSHINSRCERPPIMTRIRTFYSYSQWDDIVYPGIVLERILYGLKYNAELTTVKSGKRIPWILSKCLFTFVSYLLFLIHVVVIVVIFIFGFFFIWAFLAKLHEKRSVPYAF